MIERDTGRRLKSLNNLIRRYFDNNRDRKNIDRVTVTNGWILRYLSENQDKDIFQKDLEKKFTITRSTASKVVDLLVKKGYIERESVDYDARLKRLTLTDKAHEVTKSMKEDAAAMEQRLTEGFSEDEIKTLHSYIDRMIDNMTRED